MTPNSTIALFLTAASPVVQSTILGIAGALMAWRGTLNKQGCSTLAALCFFMFVPALTFSTIAKSVTLESIRHLWPLLANMTLSVIVGFIFGYLSPCVLHTPSAYKGIVTAAIAFGNVGNLPLVFVSAFCGDKNSIFAQVLGAECESLGTAYVAFDICMATVFQFTVAMYLLRPPASPAMQCNDDFLPVAQSDEEQDSAPISGGDTNEFDHHIMPLVKYPTVSDLLADRNSPFHQEMTCSIELQQVDDQHVGQGGGETHSHINLNRDHGTINDDTTSINNSSTKNNKNNTRNTSSSTRNTMQWIHSAWGVFLRCIKSIEWHMLFPLPTQAALAGILVGCVPQLHGIFFGTAPPLFALSNALELLGQGLVPGAIPLLGAVLFQGPGKYPSQLSLRVTLGVLVIRLIIQPLVMTLIWTLFMRFRVFVAPDPMFWMTLFVANATPTAINMQTMTVLNGFGAKEMSMILFVQYIASIFILPCHMWLFLHIIQAYGS